MKTSEIPELSVSSDPSDSEPLIISSDAVEVTEPSDISAIRMSAIRFPEWKINIL